MKIKKWIKTLGVYLFLLLAVPAFAAIPVVLTDGSGNEIGTASNPITTSGGGGGGSGAVTLQEGDVTTHSGTLDTIDLNDSDFDTSESPSGEVNVIINSGLTRDTEWDTMAEINSASTDTDAVLDTDIGSTVQAYDADLDDLADGTLSGSKIEDVFVSNAGDTMTGKLFTTLLAITDLDCTGNSNGGALTTDASGNVSCSDDNSGGGGGGSTVTIEEDGVSITSGTLTLDFDGTDFVLVESPTDDVDISLNMTASGTEFLYLTSSGTIDGSSTFKFTDSTKTITNTGTIKSTTGYIVGSGLDQNEDLIIVDRASSDAIISWDETNEEFDLTHTIHVSGTVQATGIEVDTGVIYIQEQADANNDVAGYGQLWVNTATPNELYFTDDAGTDFQLGVGGAGSNWDTIGDPSGDGTVAFAGTQQLITTTLDDATAGIETALTISNTDTLSSNENSLLDLIHAADDDDEVFFLRLIDNDTENVILFQDWQDVASHPGAVQVINDDTLLTNDQIAYSASFVDDGDSNAVGFKMLDNSGADTVFEVRGGGSIFLLEQSAAQSDVAGLGQIWVKNDAGNTLYFTDDAGVDHDLTAAGSGDVTDVFDCASGDCSSITMTAGDVLDTTNGTLELPQQTDCTGEITEGRICWETGDDALFVGNGTTATQIGTGGSSSYVFPMGAQSAKISGTFILDGTMQIEGGDGFWSNIAASDAHEYAGWHFVPTITPSTSCVYHGSVKSTEGEVSTKVDPELDFMCVSSGESIVTASFDTINEISGGVTLDSTDDNITTFTITATNLDSMAAFDNCFVRLGRDYDDADDTATKDVKFGSGVLICQ